MSGVSYRVKGQRGHVAAGRQGQPDPGRDPALQEQEGEERPPGVSKQASAAKHRTSSICVFAALELTPLNRSSFKSSQVIFIYFFRADFFVDYSSMVFSSNLRGCCVDRNTRARLSALQR